MKKALSIIMALVIVISTFSVVASAYTYGGYITAGRFLLEPGTNIGNAPTFVLGERVYGEVKENEVAYYKFAATTDDVITFKVETSDLIDFTIAKNGSNDKYTFSTNDTDEYPFRIDKGAIYSVSVKLSENANYGTSTADATVSAEYCFTTSYKGMPTSVSANINFSKATLTVGESLLLNIDEITVPNINIFWRVYDDPKTDVIETDVATVSQDGLVKIKMNNGSFKTDTEIKVQAVWYYGTADEMTKTCTINAIAANISIDPYFDTNTRQLYTGVGGFIDITAKDNLKNGIIWSSDDESIATVTPSGRITGVAVGQTEVKVTIAGTNIARRIKVNVLEGHNSVIGVNLIEDNISLRVDKDTNLMYTLTAVNPELQPTNTKANFISSNPAVATVDKSGKVRAVSTGVTTITIVTEDGYFKDTCKVTVKPAIPNWLMVVVAPLRIVINFFIMIFGKISG